MEAAETPKREAHVRDES